MRNPAALVKAPLLIAVRAVYWAPVGLVLLPARDAWGVVLDSLRVVAGRRDA